MDSRLRYLSGAEIEQATDVQSLAAKMRASYTRGECLSAEVPPRVCIVHESPFSAFNSMSAMSEKLGIFVSKVGAVVPKTNSAEPSAKSLVVAFSTQTGALLGVLDGLSMTNLKCAAVTALVTDICAPPETSVFAIIGSGAQAREQVRGVSAVRRLNQIRVYSRTAKNVANFLRQSQDIAGGAELIGCESASEAVDGADIISTATTSIEPVLAMECLQRQNLHINSLGAHTRYSREIPRDVLESSALIVEDVPTAVAEAGEIHRRAIPIAELVRRDPEVLRRQRTVFSSTGHAFLDLLTCMHSLERLGVVVPP